MGFLGARAKSSTRYFFDFPTRSKSLIFLVEREAYCQETGRATGTKEHGFHKTRNLIVERGRAVLSTIKHLVLIRTGS